MQISDKFSYRYYDLENPIMVVYNYVNGATYYYESISAEILKALIINNEDEVKRIAKVNELAPDDIDEFISEINMLFNISKIKTEINENFANDIIDNGDTIAQICNEMYKNNILYRFHIDVTGRCNFRCIHCYHTFDKYSEDMLSLDEIDSIFKKLYELGVFIITISGGEPFVRRDILEIIKLAEKYDFVVQILTNGFFLNEDIIQVISSSNVCKLSFSYYGSEQIHNLITGNEKSHKKLIHGINLCEKYSIPYELKFVLLNENIDEFDDYVKMCEKRGLRVLFEPCLIPKLDGCDSIFEHKLDFNRYKEFMATHIHFFYDGTDITKYSDKCINCSAGKYGLYCDHTGSVYPCVSYREYLGNWSDIEDIWNNSEKIKEIRERKHEQFLSFNKYSFCRYCYQICPGLSLCENGNSMECKNSGCLVAQVIESVKNEIN